jgi:hypothetical protein
MSRMFEAILESIKNLFSNAPPARAIWIGIIISFILGFLQIFQYWQKRGRLQIKILTAVRYCYRFSEEEAINWSTGMLHPSGGDPKGVFSILEFSITNWYDRDIVVGRINVFGWIFSDHYQPFLYDHERDYRVFDLFEQEKTSLDKYSIIPPSSTIGFRLEAYQDQGIIVTSSRVSVELPVYFTIEVQTDVGSKRQKKRPKHKELMSKYEFGNVFRWSGTELLSEPMADTSPVQIIPQGVERPKFQYPISYRLKQIYYKLYYKLVAWRKHRSSQ